MFAWFPLTPMTLVPWLCLPLLLGFVVYLVPPWARAGAAVMALVSLGYGSQILGVTAGSIPGAMTLTLVDSAGITLQIDNLGGYFILTNALVTLGVIFYAWQKDYTAFFYAQVLILHGSLNYGFMVADFISLYVALEVISVATFLLMTYRRTHHTIWVGLRYLLISNTAMLFYLVGVALLYKATLSFEFQGLGAAPPEAIALITLGLLTKSGVFISGFWLPATYGAADAAVAALLSGAVTVVGSFPLLRCAPEVAQLKPVMTLFGVMTAGVGVLYALVETDGKRLLAFSSISQMGFVLVNPASAGFYALTHGLAKAALFLGLEHWPRVNAPGGTGPAWLPRLALGIPCLSMAGFPLLAGFEAKGAVLQGLAPGVGWAMTAAAVGTAIALARLLSLPTVALGRSPEPQLEPVPETASPAPPPLATGAILGLVAGLFLANGRYSEMYTAMELFKALGTIALGLGAWWAGVRHWQGSLPRLWERVEHLIGVMGLVLAGLLWMVTA